MKRLSFIALTVLMLLFAGSTTLSTRSHANDCSPTNPPTDCDTWEFLGCETDGDFVYEIYDCCSNTPRGEECTDIKRPTY